LNGRGEGNTSPRFSFIRPDTTPNYIDTVRSLPARSLKVVSQVTISRRQNLLAQITCPFLTLNPYLSTADIERTFDPEARSIEHVGVNHRRAHIFVAE
jgi:hypothetical protein